MTRVFFLSIYGLIVLLGLGASPSRGGSLNLAANVPDLAAGFISTSYDATTGILSAIGQPISFNVSGAATPDYPHINGGQYQLSAQITPTGQPVSGSLDITGTIPGLTTGGTLLTGTLSQFGFQDAGGDIFEFIYNVTGGDLASYYHGETGIILDATNSGFNGSFANSFSASIMRGFSDNGMMVPEPSSILLLLGAMALGLPVFGFRGLRRMSNSK